MKPLFQSFQHNQKTIHAQFFLLFQLFLDLFVHAIRIPRRYGHKMVHRLPIVPIFHCIGYPGDVSLGIHGQLPLHICQRMLTCVAGLGAKADSKPFPMVMQCRTKLGNLFNGYSPALGRKQRGGFWLIRTVLPDFQS